MEIPERSKSCDRGMRSHPVAWHENPQMVQHGNSLVRSRDWGCVTYREYSEQLLDHYRHPRNVGELADADAVVTVGNPAHGDVLRLSLKILEGRVSDAQFKSFGCAVAIAAGSVTTVMIRGMRLEQLERFGNLQVAEALGGVPESKMVCSVLAEQAIREALTVYRARLSRNASAGSNCEPYRGTVADSAAEAPSRG